MTSIIYIILLVVTLSRPSIQKSKRQSFYPHQTWPQLYQEIATDEFNLKVSSPPLTILSNSIVEKPVYEPQEIAPSQSIHGTAIIPNMPPPAIPVNAAAANVPAAAGAVYLGSGSIGVISLGNGAYALGSGSLGYSMNRAQPRPSASVPVYPPLPAHPSLIPAAVPSPQPLQAPPPQGRFDDASQAPILDHNGYEYLAPNRVRFGAPLQRPLRLKTRMNFALATQQQVQQQPQYVYDDFSTEG